jgi:hypothetical protein
MLTLATDRAAFAAERKPILERAERSLYGSVRYALRHHGADGQWDSVIRRTLALARTTYFNETGRRSSPELRAALSKLAADLRESLEQTQRHTAITLGAAVQYIAASLATAAINAGTLAAARADDEASGLVKVWITMHDDRVRQSHRALDGQAVGLNERFEVDGTQMTGPGDVSAPVALWINCRCILGIDRREEESMTAAGDSDVAPLTQTTFGEDDMSTDETAEVMEDAAPQTEDETIPWHGVLAPEDTLSGDGRMFTAEALRWRDLPLPLAWQKTSMPGHDGSVIVGRIDNIWRDGNLVRASGVMLTTPEADEVIGIMAEGGLRGVSVDVDDATMTVRDREGNELDLSDPAVDPHREVMAFTDGRICGATLCAIPAFAEAMVFLGHESDAAMVADKSDVAEVAASADVEEFKDLAPGITEDGPGWLTHPVDTDRLRDYWVRGPGAAKIGWGAGGDFNRCRTNLAKYVKPQYLSGYCANRHYDALGFWPGQHLANRTVDTASATAPAVRLSSLVASGSRPPAEWFEDPNLIGPSPIVVTEEGRVFGHLAAWGECHIGFGESACTVAPPSPSGYAYFKTGAVLTDKGEVPVGQITLGTGHAGPHASAAKAMAHYDNTGSVAADVAVGDDEFGIWVAGAVRPGTSESDIYALRAAALSGDWRTIGGHLELVAALAVNVPGFPIPRTQIAASGGRQTALVASGIIAPADNLSVDNDRDITTIVKAAIDEYVARQANKTKMEKLAQRLGKDPKSRMEALAARIERN